MTGAFEPCCSRRRPVLDLPLSRAGDLERGHHDVYTCCWRAREAPGTPKAPERALGSGDWPDFDFGLVCWQSRLLPTGCVKDGA